MSADVVVAERPGAGRLVLPLAESAQIGVAAGMAFAGRRVVVELVEVAGLARAADALADLATVRARSAGAWSAAVVIRVPLAAGDAIPALPAGLRVGVAAGDAAGMVAEALASGEPTVVFEAAGPGAGSLGVPRRLREGDAVTLLAQGAGVAVALDAADALGAEGVECDVIDLGGVSIVGEAAASAARTGRVVFVGHDPGALGALLGETFWRLEARPSAVRADAGVDAVVRAVNDAREG